MPMGPGHGWQSLDDAWRGLHPAAGRSLELAYQSLAGGGLPCGAVLTGAGEEILAEGRNRAYDPPGGSDPLQGTPLAHAELNVLAVARTDWELAGCTLWSTQEPCSMCAAAAAFTGVGTVRYLAPDPSAPDPSAPDPSAPDPSAPDPSAPDPSAPDPSAPEVVPDRAGGGVRTVGPSADDLWVVAANVLFLHGIASGAGLEHPTVARNRELEPETTAIVVDLMAAGLTGAEWTRGRSLRQALAGIEAPLLAATRARATRRR